MSTDPQSMLQSNGAGFMRDSFWMAKALEQANKAYQLGEVPVGAVITLNDEFIAEGHNQPIKECDPSAHAEMMVIRKAALKLQNYRLVNTTLYVTLEPCLMCVGLLVHARIKRLVFGALDPKSGGVASCIRAFELPFFNHKIDWISGVLEHECGSILKDFFVDKRKARK